MIKREDSEPDRDGGRPRRTRNEARNDETDASSDPSRTASGDRNPVLPYPYLHERRLLPVKAALLSHPGSDRYECATGIPDPMEKIEKRSRRMIKLMRILMPPRAQLGQTVALEHFTAILADNLLKDREMFREHAAPEEYELWMWHAVEETEHKAVAFDVLKAVSSKPVFYLNRVRALVMTTIFFNINLFFHLRDLLKADGLQWSPRAWARLFRYLWVEPGPLRRSIPAYLDWFRPSFHPWQHDNRDLVAAWKAEHDEDELQAAPAA